MQLTDIAEQFEAMGLSLVAMTYDSIEALKEVSEDKVIKVTLLRDEGMTHVNRLGILNDTDYEPGQRAYGVPYPGIFVISGDGIIRAKFAEESYRYRPDFSDILAVAAELFCGFK